jgi:hypothetical protein
VISFTGKCADDLLAASGATVPPARSPTRSTAHDPVQAFGSTRMHLLADAINRCR